MLNAPPTAPLTLSLQPCVFDMGRMATLIAVRSREQRMLTRAHSTTVVVEL